MHRSSAGRSRGAVVAYLAFIVFTVKTGKIISCSVIIPEFIYGDLDNGRVIVGGFYGHL